MNTRATRFEVMVNGERFADAHVSTEDQVEINLARVSGQESAILQITAFIPTDSETGQYMYSHNAVLSAGDTVTISLTAVQGSAAATHIKEAGRVSPDAEGSSCSFCGKSHVQARKLVAGSNAYICDVCIELCHEMIEEEG
jgi:hypothetical protein